MSFWRKNVTLSKRYRKLQRRAKHGSQVTRNKNAIKRLYSTRESKYYNIYTDVAEDMNITGNVDCINTVVQQATDTVTSRAGQRISMTSIMVRFHITTDDSAVGRTYKVALVYDRQPNGVIAEYGDIYNLQGVDLIKPLNPRAIGLYTRRFTVLKEKMLSTDAKRNATSMHTWYVKKNLNTHFFSTNSQTIADISSGAVYMVYCASDAETSFPKIRYFTRIRFTDS